MRAIGIDLGTTNSVAVGGMDHKVLPSRMNETLTPSVVGYVRKRKSENGEIVVGRSAINNAIRDPENTIFSIKRLMGRVYGEERVDEVQHRFNFRIAPAPADDSEDQRLRVLLNGESYTPVEISAMILREIKAGAELALGDDVTHAVITVPAYFEERQRKATTEAGALAGLKVLEVIDEPTAAAIAFGAGKEGERHRVLVYDLGGGTFDISIIQMTNGRYSVLDLAGNNWLGGDDFDHKIVSRMIGWVKEEYDYDPSQDKAFLAKAKEHAERAKIALGVQQSVEISVPFMVNVPNLGPSELTMELTREQFEDDIRPLVAETVALVSETMARQGLTPDDISEVLLVGGSTAVQLVQQEIFERFGQSKVKRHVNPMECVALGAGILAAEALLDETGATAAEPTTRVQSVTPMHLGIMAVEGDNPDAFIPIIKKGTTYPLDGPRKHVFYPTEENQSFIRVPVYEGLNERASLNEQQGVIEFPLPEGIKLSTPVEVSFNYTADRVLTVGVRVVGTQHSIESTLRRDRLRVQTAAKNRGMVDDWREDLQPSIRAAEHFLETYGQYMENDDRLEIREGLSQGATALNKSDEAMGTRATSLLRNKLIGSGTASLLFFAERAMHGLPPAQQQVLSLAVASLKRAHKLGLDHEVSRLSSELSVAIGALMERRSTIQNVEDRASLEALLRNAK